VEAYCYSGAGSKVYKSYSVTMISSISYFTPIAVLINEKTF